ncbi:MAG: hypothetical protein IT336_13985 [Thermomicrobiales bacterium]|nr:hypothetical protein [Thermomicrobiales bacterium]
MLDELFDLFDRKKDPARGRQGGLRGMIGRAISGDDDHEHRDERAARRDDRRHRDDDDDRYPKQRRRSDAFEFD